MSKGIWPLKKLENLSIKPISYGIVQTGEGIKDGIPCVRVIDLANRLIDVSRMITTTEEISNSYKRTILEKDELLIALRGEIGLAKLADSKLIGCNLTRGIARISPNRKIIDPRYLLWAIRSDHVRGDLLRRVNGSALQEIPIKELRKVLVPVPALEDQRRIVEVLEAWDSAIALTEQLITAKQKLKKNISQVLFESLPCESIKVKNICSSIVPARNKPKKFDGDIPWITTVDLEDEFWVEKSKLNLAVSRQELNSIKGKTVPSNTVIMTCVGKFGIVAVAARELVINQQLHGFVCGGEVIPEYLCWALRSKEKEMLAIAGQTTVSYLNSSKCESISVKLPSISIQKRIVEILGNAQDEINSLMKYRKKLQRQKQGLMQKLLTGEWRVPVDEVAA
ncbi:restriction endonuclease subunit S [Nodosilinea sp. AN01ver1]|uniref:restriction endonuclease subunit S n=1 Tax=Nodosilinea sp. AN01ver1 TaxID=3423362 RepID=UPI003D31B97A